MALYSLLGVIRVFRSPEINIKLRRCCFHQFLSLIIHRSFYAKAKAATVMTSAFKIGVNNIFFIQLHAAYGVQSKSLGFIIVCLNLYFSFKAKSISTGG